MTQVASLSVDPFIPPPADEPHYEVVNGDRVEMPPMSAYDVAIASLLVARIGHFVGTHHLGRAVVEMLFALNAERRLQRRPDVAYVSFEKWPQGRAVPRTNAWEVVPDLAVEVVSPTNFAEELLTRLLEFFQAGVRHVWVIYPGPEQVYHYHSPTQIQVLTRSDQINGDPVLPGFRMSVADLFDGEGATARRRPGPCHFTPIREGITHVAVPTTHAPARVTDRLAPGRVRPRR
jgi:Uma2 family endonuclease